MNNYFLGFALLFLASCHSSMNQDQQDIFNFEKSVGIVENTETANLLVRKYLSYLKNHPDDQNTNAAYLLKAAKLYYRLGHFHDALILLKKGIKDCRDAGQVADLALFSAEINQNGLADTLTAAVIYRSISQAFPNTTKPKGWTSWNGNQAAVWFNEQWTVLKTMEGINGNNQSKKYISAIEMYVLLLPKDTLSPSLLLQAGKMAVKIRDFAKGNELFDLVIRDYNNDPQKEDALFFKAFVLDNELKKTGKAKQYYEQYLSEFPEGKYGEEAQFLLDNLGKRNEIIINEMERLKDREIFGND